MADANARHPVSTQGAPAAIGPYSQAIRSGDLLFTSGQIALDPKSGELIDGDVRAQTERVMENLAAVLAAAGASFGSVLKTTIFLTDLADFKVVNEIYGRRFEGFAPPARSTVQVAALPRGAKVEIELVARL
jgi:2-iminobutanoate/2-iminopropanoate deaminase